MNSTLETIYHLSTHSKLHNYESRGYFKASIPNPQKRARVFIFSSKTSKVDHQEQ